MTWTAARIETMKLWSWQLVILAMLYMRAARWTRILSVALTMLGIFGGAYNVPGYGCGLVTGVVCTNLQWSGIVIGVVVLVANGAQLAYDSPTKAAQYHDVAKTLLNLARDIMLELDEPANNAHEFAERVVEKYEKALKDVRLPWYVNGEHQLASLSLLQNYSGLREQRVVPVIEVTDEDRAVMRKMTFEMERLGGSREFVDEQIAKL